MAQKFNKQIEMCEYVNSRYQDNPMGEALSVLRKMKPNAMSSRGMDDEDDEDSSQEVKTIRCIPVRWLNPAVVEMFHAVDTWLPFLNDEKIATGDELDCRGNRPLM